jgi:hypothetical protein
MIEPKAPTATFRAAMLARDVPGVLAATTPDVVLKSPITDRFSFRGHRQLAELMADVFVVIEDLHYTDDVGDARTRALTATGRVGDAALEESVLVRLDEAGLIEELTLFVRPMPALVALAAELGPRVARRRSRGRGAVVTAMMKPLAFVTRSGEGLGARLARP